MDTDLQKVEIVISWSRQDPVWGVRRKIRSKIDTPKKSPRYPPALLSTQGKSQTWYSSLKFIQIEAWKAIRIYKNKAYLSSLLRFL